MGTIVNQQICNRLPERNCRKTEQSVLSNSSKNNRKSAMGPKCVISNRENEVETAAHSWQVTSSLARDFLGKPRTSHLLETCVESRDNSSELWQRRSYVFLSSDKISCFLLVSTRRHCFSTITITRWVNAFPNSVKKDVMSSSGISRKTAVCAFIRNFCNDSYIFDLQTKLEWGTLKKQLEW